MGAGLGPDAGHPIPVPDAGGGGALDAATHDAAVHVIPDAAAPDAHTGAVTDAGQLDAATSDAAPDAASPDAAVDEDHFAMRVVAQGLESPWEVTWGPDQQLWITEREGLRVVRVDPQSGARSTALTVADAYQTSGQDGLLGMALDARLGGGTDGQYVYLAYTYDANPGGTPEPRARIVRYSYDASSGSLSAPLVLLEGLPASSDHNSGRLVYGPDSQLYYTIGDQGHNQFAHMCEVNRAQVLPTQLEIEQGDWSAYQGKVLRIGRDGSIPTDNPVLDGVRSHVWSYGHRNAQGIAFGASGRLYASEQGPKTDDELNLIWPGKNYGWPFVAGYRDDMAYAYGNWSASSPEPCASLEYSDYYVPESVPRTLESAWWSEDFVPPLATFFTVNDSFDFAIPQCGSNAFICWPTIAPSSLEVYAPGAGGLQSWGNSLLIPSLKRGSVYRVRLNASGDATLGEATELFKTTNRYRDLTIAPDRRTFYVVTDSYGSTSGPTATSTQQLDHRGAILEFRQQNP